MANFGDYTKTVYANTIAPAINQTNLNNNENKLALIDEELRRSQTFRLSDYLNVMYQCNTKEIEAFQDSTDWTMDTGGTISNDTTNYLMHNQSVKLLEPDNTAGYLCMYKACSLDLTVFPNENVSSADDHVLLIVYIDDVAALTNLYFKLGSDNTNCYYKITAAASLVTGWNFISIAKSAFTSGGTPPGWDNITYIRCEWYSNASKQNKYVSFQYAQLIREDSVYAGYYNPFQLYNGTTWENLFSIIYDYYCLYYDQKYNKLCIQALNPVGYANMLHIPFCDRANFIFKCKMICNYIGESQNLVWYVDSDNYIQIGLYGNDLSMYYNEAGVGSSSFVNLDSNFRLGEELELTFEKNGTTVRAIAKLHGLTKTIEYTTSITDEGCLYFGSMDDESYSLVEDFVLTHTQGFKFQENKIKIIRKTGSETVNNSSVLQNDDHLIAYLEENGLYEIELKLAVNGANNADFKAAWAITGGITQVTTRACFGAATSSTDNTDTNMRATGHNLTTSVAYGTDVTTANAILEKFLVSTSSSGTITFQWAQNTAQASNTIVSENSYMKITKIN
ncbi:MAG: hypothetical protein PHP92_05235 [Candidatus Nanoarchaeia archaeon]|nr:hypothetical protein [Candidatus Nanoarchaeia archaeon]